MTSVGWYKRDESHLDGSYGPVLKYGAGMLGLVLVGSMRRIIGLTHHHYGAVVSVCSSVGSVRRVMFFFNVYVIHQMVFRSCANVYFTYFISDGIFIEYINFSIIIMTFYTQVVMIFFPSARGGTGASGRA